MITTQAKGPQANDFFLLNLVDFKWLMAGAGWWVDLSRLQRALKSGSELLRKRSVELLGLRHGSDAHCDVAMPRAFTGSAL